jgi:hypothetical protein
MPKDYSKDSTPTNSPPGIHATVVGNICSPPTRRKSKGGKDYATSRIQAGADYVSVVVFEMGAAARLLKLNEGDAV